MVPEVPVCAERSTHDETDDDEPGPRFDSACAAFCRGALGLALDIADDDAMRAGVARGLRLHRFKRARPLPRVTAVLGALRAFNPQALLDIGTGRGVFLWPLLEALPAVEVTCVDLRPDRVDDLSTLARGGLVRVRARVGSAESLREPDGALDVVTALEVLEHVADPARAAREIVRVARRAVIASVPSQPDDNPEHIRLFTRATLTELFVTAGAKRVDVTSVLGHFIAVVPR
ncbi:MAG TPA: class I SAM-dependent methyltransferase [Myxococcota bacterium]